MKQFILQNCSIHHKRVNIYIKTGVGKQLSASSADHISSIDIIHPSHNGFLNLQTPHEQHFVV